MVKRTILKTKDDAIDFICDNYPYAWDLFHNWYLDRSIEENIPIAFIENDSDILDINEEYEEFSTYSILDFEVDVFIGVFLKFISDKAYLYPEIVEMYNRSYSHLTPDYMANVLQFVVSAFRMIETGDLRTLN